jgi:hypothetical protein
MAIPRWGLPGAAAGALTAVLTLRGLQLIESRRLVGVDGFSAAWLRVAAAVTCSGVLQVALRLYWGHDPAHALVGLVLGVLVYVLLIRLGPMSAS